jgi:hypothetical protein
MPSTIILGSLAIFLLMALQVTIHASSSSINAAATTATITDSNQTGTSEQTTDVYQNPLVGILANELETKINKSGAILEITSRLPEVSSAPFASSISPELHGIPRDADIPKRKVAQDILDTDKDFEVIYFLLPNGDMYLLEPYSRQENLTRNNFAFRDYYIGALETGNTYLSDILISASSGRPQANIAVPIYSENNNNQTLVGLWGGGLNITMLSSSLQSLNLADDERVVYLDQQGQRIADSDNYNNNNNIQSSSVTPNDNSTSSNESSSFASLQAFKDAAINGQSGSTIEMINGNMMLVSYHPVEAFSNVWVVLFMEPYPLTEIRSSSSSSSSSSDVSMLLSSSQLITTTPYSINDTSSLNSIFGDPFFVDMGSKDTGSRVISTNPIQTEDSYIANVTIRGVGNATDKGTFITTYDPDTKTTTSIGQGIITSSSDGSNETATYTAKDLGVTNEEGEVTYRGIQIFDTNSTGKMSFMDNLVGLYVYEDNPDGTRKSGMIWEWK